MKIFEMKNSMKEHVNSIPRQIKIAHFIEPD